ncbi:MAG: efflux RND transporter permease subunit, partial [Acidobacteriota bacterium]
VGSLPSTASGRQTLGENLAQVNVVLHEQATAATEAGAVERVREVLTLYPSVEAELIKPSVLALRPPVVVNIFDDDLGVLDRQAQRVTEAVSLVPGVKDVTSTSEPGSPEVRIALDRERAGALGISAEQIGETLRRQIRGEIVGEFREEEERLDIRVRASSDWRDRASEVGSLRIRRGGDGSEPGTSVPVSAVADVEIDRGPAAIYRVGSARVAQVIGLTTSRDLGRVLTDVRQAIARIAPSEGAVIELAGQDQDIKISFDSLKLALALAVFLVYVVMAMQFESIRYPFVILLSVPMGIVGVVAALMLSRTSISVLVLIGSVMLAGIVVNNAIVLVDAINRRRRLGEALDDAILGGGRERLRPILMTTTTTVLALLPMVLGLGAGSELRAPLAITVIGGLTVATVLTLIVIPCVYRIFSGRIREGESASAAAARMAPDEATT